MKRIGFSFRPHDCFTFGPRAQWLCDPSRRPGVSAIRSQVPPVLVWYWHAGPCASACGDQLDFRFIANDLPPSVVMCVLEKDLAPHLTSRQEQTVKLLDSHKAPFRRYPECFLCLVGLSPYGLVDFIKTVFFTSDKLGVVVLLRLRIIPAPKEGGQENVVEEDAYLEKVKKRRLQKQSNVLPAKKLRTYHPALASGAGGKTLAGLEQIRPAGSRLSDEFENSLFFPPLSSFSGERRFFGFFCPNEPPDLYYCGEILLLLPQLPPGLLRSSKWQMDINPDLGGPSIRGVRKGLMTLFIRLLPWTLPRRSAEFNIRAARQVCLGAEVRSRAEHELELKEKLRVKYDARSRLLEEKDLEILKLKSKLAKKEAEAAEKDHDISLLNSRATSLASTLDDAKVTYADVRHKITSLASERDRLASEVSSLHVGFQDFKERMEEGGRNEEREKFSFSLRGDAYNPEAARARYVDAVKALEDVDFPLVSLLKSKKDAGMDEVLDSFLLDGPLAGLLEAAYLQPCIEQLSVPIHHAGDTTVVGETSLSFALMNVHARAEGAKKHDAALRQLMMDIVSAPLSSQTWGG
ncbi:hypothetical protein Tco_0398540 [Tanacetum coccineum]